jgi:hypothetical protein
MGDRWVLGDQGLRWSDSVRPAAIGALSDAWLRLEGSGPVRLDQSLHKRQTNNDDVGFGCSVGARAPWTGEHQMDVSACDPWTDLHQQDW